MGTPGIGGGLAALEKTVHALYNEIEPYAAEWLRNLIGAGHIAPGRVDERSIADLTPDDVAGPGQRHFFAGIGVWSHALRLAGWPDDLSVWTGSCPCQPFSTAGRRRGVDDERHLWPDWFRLIRECRPTAVFGEQVASLDVVGPACKDSDVQGMQDREAVLGLLRQFQGRSPMDMHRLHEVLGEDSEAFRSVEDVEEFQTMERREPGEGPGGRSSTSSEIEGAGVRSKHRRDRGARQRRSVRVDRDPVRSDGTEVVECAIPGQDRSLPGLHDEQYARGALRGQRDGERMGSGQDYGDRCRDCGEAAQCLGCALGEVGAEPDASPLGPWIDVVRSDLESIGYTVGFSVLPAASVGAPHIRQRLYFVAVAVGDAGRTGGRRYAGTDGRAEGASTGARSPTRGVGDIAVATSATRELADSDDAGSQGRGERWDGLHERPARPGGVAGAGATRGFWYPADWIPCRDGKARPVEPGTFPLAHGATARVGRLRAYGNAIVAPQAATFVASVMDWILR